MKNSIILLVFYFLSWFSKTIRDTNCNHISCICPQSPAMSRITTKPQLQSWLQSKALLPTSEFCSAVLIFKYSINIIFKLKGPRMKEYHTFLTFLKQLKISSTSYLQFWACYVSEQIPKSEKRYLIHFHNWTSRVMPWEDCQKHSKAN